MSEAEKDSGHYVVIDGMKTSTTANFKSDLEQPSKDAEKVHDPKAALNNNGANKEGPSMTTNKDAATLDTHV